MRNCFCFIFFRWSKQTWIPRLFLPVGFPGDRVVFSLNWKAALEENKAKLFAKPVLFTNFFIHDIYCLVEETANGNPIYAIVSSFYLRYLTE